MLLYFMTRHTRQGVEDDGVEDRRAKKAVNAKAMQRDVADWKRVN